MKKEEGEKDDYDPEQRLRQQILAQQQERKEMEAARNNKIKEEEEKGEENPREVVSAKAGSRSPSRDRCVIASRKLEKRALN